MSVRPSLLEGYPQVSLCTVFESAIPGMHLSDYQQTFTDNQHKLLFPFRVNGGTWPIFQGVLTLRSGRGYAVNELGTIVHETRAKKAICRSIRHLC